MIEFIEDLTKIATPDAAKALVDFLWNTNESLRFKAAWNLAALFTQNDITEALKDIEITVEQKNEEYLDWIWQPFNDSLNQSLSIIAGRIVYLLDKTPTKLIPHPLPKLDPRLIVPLLSLHKLTDVEVLQSNNRWNPLADSLLKQQEQTSEIEQKISEQVKNILGQEFSQNSWKIILSSLEPKLQLDLLNRLINRRCPTSKDWLNLFLEIKYEFQNSYHYRSVLAVGLIASVIAIIKIFSLIYHQPENSLNGFLGLAIYIILVFWFSFWQVIERGLEPNTFLEFGLLGIVTFETEIQRLLKDRLASEKILPFYKSVFVIVAAIVTLGTVFAVFEAGRIVLTAFADYPDLLRVLYHFVRIAVMVPIAIVAARAIGRAVAGVIRAFVGFVGAGAVAVAVTFVAIAADTAIAGTGVAIIVAGVAGAGAVAVNFAGAVVGVAAAVTFVAVTADTATAGAVIAAALIGIGLGIWDRAKSQTDFMRFLAIFAFPLFCWFPIVFVFSTLFMLRYITWQFTTLIWLIVFGTCTALWRYGQDKHRKASNPLKGILDVAK